MLARTMRRTHGDKSLDERFCIGVNVPQMLDGIGKRSAVRSVPLQNLLPVTLCDGCHGRLCRRTNRARPD